MNEGNGVSGQPRPVAAVSLTPPPVAPVGVPQLVQQSLPPLPPINPVPSLPPPNSSQPAVPASPTQPTPPPTPQAPVSSPSISPPPVVQPVAMSPPSSPPAQAPAPASVPMPVDTDASQAVVSTTPAQPVEQTVLPTQTPVSQPTPLELQPAPPLFVSPVTPVPVVAAAPQLAPPQQEPSPPAFQAATPTLEEISQLLDEQLNSDTKASTAQSPYSKPGIDLRPGKVFERPEVQGSPESFMQPVESQPEVATPPPYAPADSEPTPKAQTAPEAKPEHPVTPEGTPVPAHKNLVPPSEDDEETVVKEEPKATDAKPDEKSAPSEAEQTSPKAEEIKPKSEFLPAPFEKPKKPNPISEISDVRFIRVDKQVSSTGREVDERNIRPPKKQRKFGALILAVVVAAILCTIGFVTYNYISQNLMERTLSCSTRSSADSDAQIPPYSADLKISLVGKKPVAAGISYKFIYNDNVEADGVAPKTAISMAEDINRDFKIYIDNTTKPVTKENNITATVNYAPQEFLNRLIGEQSSNNSSEEIVELASSKLDGLGYTCTLGGK